MHEERTATTSRRTAETAVEVTVCLDGSGQYRVGTGIGFFDHMLALFTRHGLFDLTVAAQGDLHVDAHHTVEDTGLALGRALARALGEKQGIRRYGTAFVPMDEALVMVVVDVSGRPYLAWDAALPAPMVGTFPTELVEEFLRAMVTAAGLTLHVRVLAGRNTHHIIEAVFKALGRALAEAVARDPRITGVMSTKGQL